MLAKLVTGRGTENYALNLIKYKPDNIDILLIEPNFVGGKCLTESYVNDVTKNCHIVTLCIKDKLSDNLFKNVYIKLVSKPLFKYVKAIKDSVRKLL
jgi:hypothetical protein